MSRHRFWSLGKASPKPSSGPAAQPSRWKLSFWALRAISAASEAMKPTAKGTDNINIIISSKSNSQGTALQLLLLLLLFLLLLLGGLGMWDLTDFCQRTKPNIL